jgi:hypothetical protein
MFGFFRFLRIPQKNWFNRNKKGGQIFQKVQLLQAI